MICVLYRLRRWGERLPDAEVKAAPQPGRLVFNFPPGTAQLLDGERMLAQLLDVKVVKIDGGILLGGWEEHQGKPQTRQTWWCLPGLFDDTTAYR